MPSTLFRSFPPPECSPVDEAVGRCITARRGSVRFICLCCSFLLSFAIFSPAPLGYARMVFLGHVICFACTLLLYVKRPISAPFSQSSFYEFFSLFLDVVSVSFDVFFFFSLMFDYFFVCAHRLHLFLSSFVVVSLFYLMQFICAHAR